MSPMQRLVFDIETDNLYFECENLWIVAVKCLDTGEKRQWRPGEDGWKEVLSNAKLVVGHNVIDFDLPALKKLTGFVLPKSVKVHDTLLLSLILNYNREGGHKLASWGLRLGYPKLEFEDFSKFTEEMLTYCIRDVDLTAKVYRILLDEFDKIYEKSPQIATYVKAEHAVAKWCAAAKVHGWPFDVPAALELFAKLEEEVEKSKLILQPLLGMKTVPVDKKKGEVEFKIPKWQKNGGYQQHTASWFDIPWESGQDEDRLIEGPYSRVEFRQLDIDSIADVKIFLHRNGWQPTEWNTKFNPETKRNERTSPKITEDSLEALQGNGKLYCEFLTNKSRRDILKGWLNNVDEKGFLHGECFTIGTPSMRARHSIIVNVPAADSVWGKEMRQLFTCMPGWTLIGCDSAGNQARGLAHYLQSPEYIDLLLNGDVHTFNANILTEVLAKLGIDHKVPRGVAKRVLYAFLFGASGTKLLSYIMAANDATLGNKVKNGFTKAVPGFKNLIDHLENIYGKTSQYDCGGYIPGIAGNRIYCDSFHKLLVYLLQACEKATCGAAVMLTMERLEEAGIPYIPCIMYHDELDMMVPDKYVEQAAIITKQTMIDGPKLFGITIMDGEAKTGRNWYDIH